MKVPRANAETLARSVGERVQELRLAAKLTFQRLADESGVVKSTVWKVEQGDQGTSLAVLELLATRLEVEPIDLLLLPGEEQLRHRVIEATRGLPPDRLRAMLAASSGPPVPPPPRPPFEELEQPRGRIPPDVIPYVGLDVAAGGFDSRERGMRWVRPTTKRRLHRECFVARVVGRSMEPVIHDGEYVIFSRRFPPNLKSGAIVLAKYGGDVDADTSTSYTVKRFHGVPARRGSDAPWSRVELKPENPLYKTLTIDGDRLGDLAIVAELVEVLRPDATDAQS